MQPRREGKIRSAQRAALLLWIAAHTLSASTLPGQHGDRYSVWKLAVAEAAQPASARSEPAPAFEAATAMEPPNSLLVGVVVYPASPRELGFDMGVAYAPSTEKGDPLRGAEPPTWMSVGVAAALLAGTTPRHHRRRTRTGHRHAAEPVA